MKVLKIQVILLAACSFLWGCGPAQAKDQPNIVLVFMDNFGWGEPGFNGGGIIRGAPTPRLDQLAAEGIRLTNFKGILLRHFSFSCKVCFCFLVHGRLVLFLWL